MAWCLIDPVDGPCSPDIAFWSFEKLLEKYYKEQITEAERQRRRLPYAARYLSSVFQKHQYEVGSVLDHKVIEPLAPHEFPTEVSLGKNYSALGAWLSLQRRIIAVEDRLKTLIEGLEPGVHRFWPLRLVKPNGQDFPVQYYGLVIDRFLDSFNPGATKPEAFEGGEEFYDGGGNLCKSSYSVRGVGSKSKYNALAFDAATIGDAHLWRERRLTNRNIFISEELKAAIDAAGMKIPTHYQVKTV